MTNQTSTTARTIVQGYYYVVVQPATGGFGEYQASVELGDEYYEDASDLIMSFEPCEYVSTDSTDWMDHEDIELVEGISDVTGNMYNEPETLVAMRDVDGKVTVFGIDSMDCYEQVGGEYVPVTTYEDYPEGYTLV